MTNTNQNSAAKTTKTTKSTTAKSTASKTTAAKRTTKPTPKKAPTPPVQEVVEAVEVVETAPQRARRVVNIDLNDYIPCRSTQTNLIYKSNRTGEKIVWSEFGDVQEITFGELKTMKATYGRFFSQGWLIVEDEEAINHLGLGRTYGNMLEVEDLDEFFGASEDEMERILQNVPQGFKKSLAVFARERIQDGRLDSNRKIKLLEELLQVELKMFE